MSILDFSLGDLLLDWEFGIRTGPSFNPTDPKSQCHQSERSFYMHTIQNFSVNSIFCIYVYYRYRYSQQKGINRVHHSSGKIEHLAKSLTFKNNGHHWLIVHKQYKHVPYFQESFLIQHQHVLHQQRVRHRLWARQAGPAGWQGQQLQ